LDMSFYDSADFYDHLHRARDEASYRPISLLESLGTLLQHGITLVAMGALLARFGVWLPVALLISTLPALFAVLHSSLEYHAWRRARTPDERRAWYLDWILTAGTSAAGMDCPATGCPMRTSRTGAWSRGTWVFATFRLVAAKSRPSRGGESRREVWK
jgi:hypothetical protein